MFSKILVVITFLVFVNGQYWIDSTLGSDSNPGTQAAPFKTILKASGELDYTVGDVTLKDGNYTIPHFSQPHYITFKAANKLKATIVINTGYCNSDYQYSFSGAGFEFKDVVSINQQISIVMYLYS